MKIKQKLKRLLVLALLILTVLPLGNVKAERNFETDKHIKAY